MGVLCAFYFRRPRSRVNFLMEDTVSRLVVLVFSLWFYCLRIHVDLYVPGGTVLPLGAHWGMFPTLTNPHEIAAAGPRLPKRLAGKYKVPSPRFLYQAQTPRLGLRLRGLSCNWYTSPYINSMIKWNVKRWVRHTACKHYCINCNMMCCSLVEGYTCF